MHIAPIAHYHGDNGFRQRHGNSSGVPGAVYNEIVICDDISQGKAIFTYYITCQLFLDFSDQIVGQDYLSVSVQGSYGPCECSRLQIKLIDTQWTVYGVACYGYMIKQNLNLRRNLLTKFKPVMSYNSQKEWSKQISHPDKWQPSGCINPGSKLPNSPLRLPAHGREVENWLWYPMQIEGKEVDTKWRGRRAILIEN